MEIKGTIIQILPAQGGQTRAGGEWRKQEYVLETLGEYPKKVVFHLWGERIDQYPALIGDPVVVQFDVESREYNGRWYTDLRAWKMDKQTDVSVEMVGQSPAFSAQGSPIATFTAAPSATDDLPF